MATKNDRVIVTAAGRGRGHFIPDLLRSSGIYVCIRPDGLPNGHGQKNARGHQGVRDFLQPTVHYLSDAPDPNQRRLLGAEVARHGPRGRRDPPPLQQPPLLGLLLLDGGQVGAEPGHAAEELHHRGRDLSIYVALSKAGERLLLLLSLSLSLLARLFAFQQECARSHEERRQRQRRLICRAIECYYDYAKETNTVMAATYDVRLILPLAVKRRTDQGVMTHIYSS